MFRHKLYIIVSYNTHGQKDRLGAYFSEEKARYAASRIVGREMGQFISLETLEILDDPLPNLGDEIGAAQR